MSRACVVLVTVVALGAASAQASEAQLLPLPFRTRTPTPVATGTPTRTATPTLAGATATRTRTPTPVATAGARLPDLVPEIRDVQLQLAATVGAGDVAEGCAEATSGVDLLRFSALSRNVGTADLVLGDPGCPTPCSDHPLEVCADRDYVCSPAEGHNHPHYANYARYELLDASRNVVVVGHKQGYCLRDTNCAAPVYTCTNQGISAGCFDTYDYTLGCQYLDVTGVAGGSYVLRVTIDPLGKIPEASEANNVTEQAVVIARPGVPTATATRSATPMRTPTASAAPVRTATPAPTATRTATPARTVTPSPRPTAAASPSTPVPSPTAFAGTPADARAAACVRAVLTASRTLLGRTLGAIDACADAVAACEPARRRGDACRARSFVTCDRAAADVDAARAAFVARVQARCGDLAAAGRLGSAVACGDPAAGDDAPTVARCIAARVVCSAGRLGQSASPSLGARLACAGRRDADLCVADLGGPDPDAPELAEARAIDACGRAVRRAARRFARHRLAVLQSCLAADAGCAAAADRDACRQRARVRCAARVAQLAPDPALLGAAIARGCGALDFALAREPAAANLGALASACVALGGPEPRSFAEHAQCLARSEACSIDDVLRAAIVEAAAGLGGWPAPGGACPGAPD